MPVGSLYQRQAKLTFLVPTTQPGDFNTTVATQLVVNGSTDPLVPGLRVKFEIEKTLEATPNRSRITVTNLSEQSRKLLETKGTVLLLEAGYSGTGISRIYSGNVRTCDHERVQADWNTVLQCGDGDSSFRFARVTESFKPGTTYGQVLTSIAKATGLDLGNVPQIADTLNKTFDHGYVANGSSQRAMTRFLKQFGYSWSIQDGALQVLGPDQTTADASLIPLISPATGLIGSPEMGTPEEEGKPALCVFRTLLIPGVTPGAKVHLKSDRYDTDLQVMKAHFIGDTHGNEWEIKIHGQLPG